MKIVVFGGDGFCGWPTALHLSSLDHEIFIVDNFSRRNIDNELNVQSLTPIATMKQRLDCWAQLTGAKIHFENLDIAKEPVQLRDLLRNIAPDALVHFAEQRAAPYSMKSFKHKIYTVNNNLNATNNLLAALVDLKLDCHFIHLGTMGVYGYGTAGITIPEGYLDVTVKKSATEDVHTKILYPSNPGSVYHLTKVQDQHAFAYYNKNDGIRITDLHQGIVWGTQTKDTQLDDALINRFDYDGDYGTVLNRFLMQAVLEYPLTVHGTGGQTRAFIHIKDTVKCIELALNDPPKLGQKVKILNQMTETHRVIELAKLVAEKTGAEVQLVDNPRNEDQENDLNVSNAGLLDMGLDPTYLNDGLLNEVIDVVKKNIKRCDLDLIPCTSKW